MQRNKTTAKMTYAWCLQQQQKQQSMRSGQRRNSTSQRCHLASIITWRLIGETNRSKRTCLA